MTVKQTACPRVVAMTAKPLCEGPGLGTENDHAWLLARRTVGANARALLAKASQILR